MNAPATRHLPETLELAVRPGAVFARVLARPVRWPAVLAALAAPVTAVAAVSAFSYVGAVTAGHFLANAGAYLAFFGVQLLGAVLVAKLATRRPLGHILHAVGLTYLPLEIFFVFLLGVFVVAPDPYTALVSLVRSYVLPVLFGIALISSAILIYVAYRELAGGRRGRALACTAAHYAFFAGFLCAYIFGMGLLPMPQGA